MYYIGVTEGKIENLEKEGKMRKIENLKKEGKKRMSILISIYTSHFGYLKAVAD